jgi:hypothetical protein
MKKKLRHIIAILCCVAALAVGARSAENRSSVFEIPFEFIVKKQTFPAGKYSVARLDAANPGVLILKQVGGKLKTIIQTRGIAAEKTRAQSHLCFRRGDAGLYLTEIWEADGGLGYHVWSAEIE